MADREMDERLTGQIDVIVAEVFHMMLQLDCGAMIDPVSATMDISARVLLTEAVDAQCVIEFPPETARKLTNVFMGSEGDWEEDVVDDVLGELANMIAGGWKSQMESPASASRLSLPVITRGPDRHTLDADTHQWCRAYTLGDAVFQVHLAIL